MKIGPAFLLKLERHTDVDEAVLDIGGMLHKSFQLVGAIDHAVVEITGTLDPTAVKNGNGSWVLIGHLTAADPYKHHVGFMRWVRARATQGSDEDRFGVVLMGEE